MDQDGVKSAIDLYSEGMCRGDVRSLREAFHERASLSGSIDGELRTIRVGQWLDAMADGDPAAAADASSTNLCSMHVVGDGATAILEEWSTSGDKFLNYFTLIRVTVTWKILTKVFLLA